MRHLDTSKQSLSALLYRPSNFQRFRFHGVKFFSPERRLGVGCAAAGRRSIPNANADERLSRIRTARLGGREVGRFRKMVGSGLYGRMGLFARACPKRRSYGCAIGLGSLLRIAGCLSFRIRSAYRCGAFCPCDGTREEARPSVGHVPPAGLFRPDSSARTFSPDVPLRTFPSYSLGGRFVSGSRGALRFRRRILAAAFPFVRFFRIFA